MAEGHRGQRITIEHHYHIVHEGEKTTIGTNIGQQTNIRAGVIEQVGLSTAADQAPDVNEEVIEGNERPNLATDSSKCARKDPRGDVSSELGRMKLTEQYVDANYWAEDPSKSTRKDSCARNSTPQRVSSEREKTKPTEQCGDNYFAEEEAEALKQWGKFDEAISLLQDLPMTQRQQMILAECYFQIRSDEKAKKCIGNMKTMVVRQPRPEAFRVCSFGFANFQTSVVKAMTFFACAAKIYLLQSTADESVRGIQNCSYQCSLVILAMIKQSERMRILACDVGMEIMNGFVDDATSVENCDPGVKADVVAHCLSYTGICYNGSENYQRAIEFYKRGIDIMNHQFGENSSKYLVFGKLLHNMGTANANLGNYSEAETLYKRSTS